MASRSASPNPSRPSIHSTRTTEATRRHSSSDTNLSGSSEDFRHRRGRDAVCSTLGKPSSSSSKGAKRFMSPTISAASKAVAVAAAPSPRRKILGERNEDASLFPSLHSPAMDAVVLKKPDAPGFKESSGRSKDSSGRELRPGHELGFGSEDGPCCYGCGECGEHMDEEDAEIKNHQYGALRTFRISPAANGPFGADRHLPPYDPDTNYLSPRPRFLHYRPNPRIEQYLHGESEFLMMEDGRRLDDSFSDVSCEDSSACVGEVESSDREEEESSMGFFSRSPSSVSTSLGDTGEGLVCRPAVEAGGNVQASTGLKFAPFLLALILVCLMPLFFWNAPAISSASSSLTKAPVLQVIDVLRIRDYLAVSASNLKELIYKMKQFSSNTFGRHSTAATLPEIGALYMDNFTVAAKESSDQKRPGVDISHICLQADRSGEDEMKAVNEAEVSGVAFEVVGDMKAETTKGAEEQVEVENDKLKVEKIQDLGGEANRNDSSPGSPSPEAESFHTEGSLLEHGSEQILQEEDGGSAESKEKTFENEIVEFGEQDLLPDLSTKNEVTLPPQIQLSDSGDFYSEPISKAFDLQELSTHASDATSWSKLALGVSSTFILIAAGAAASVFLPRKQKQQSQAVGEMASSANLDPESTAQRSKNYEVDSSDFAYHIPMDHYESSTNLMESSSIGTRRTTKGGHGDQEEQDDVSLSLERRTRRDSIGLSSSTSYGSFTTYEKVSAKKGVKAKYNEAMTPVRRSSRIKNHQVAS